MKSQRLAFALTVINLVILTLTFVRLRPAVAEHGIAPVLRGHSLEIIDDHGRVRSQILVTAPTTGPDGKNYPEGVLFRLIDPDGRPSVKIGGSADGSGISLAGDSGKTEWSGIQILANAPEMSLKVTHRDGRQEVIPPSPPPVGRLAAVPIDGLSLRFRHPELFESAHDMARPAALGELIRRTALRPGLTDIDTSFLLGDAEDVPSGDAENLGFSWSYGLPGGNLVLEFSPERILLHAHHTHDGDPDYAHSEKLF